MPAAQSHHRLLLTIAAATALIFIQAYMVAPLLPRLAAVFDVPVATMGLAVPAYLFAYGVATLVYGVLLEPLLGWRGLFLGVAALAVLVLAALVKQSALLVKAPSATPPSLGAVLGVYGNLLSSPRGRRTYGYVYLNAVLHAGVFTWLAVYLSQRYQLSEVGIGLALLGYGIPGFLFGPLIGRLADHWGRNQLIPLGLLLAGLCALALTWQPPLIVIPLVVTLLSLGYDLTQPLLAGIVTDLSPQRGQAMGLNVMILFLGFGSGALILGSMLPLGLTFAFRVFGAGAVLAALAALRLFRAETHRA